MEKELIKLLEDLAIRSFLSITNINCVKENEGSVLKFEISSNEPNVLIGKYGETLFALQQIFRLIAEKKFGDELPHLILDVDKYRDNQTQNAIYLAEEAIRRMKRDDLKEAELPPMASYKRRAIHYYVLDKYPNIKTQSSGTGEERKVILSIKEDA